MKERRLYVGVRLSAEELATVDGLAVKAQVSRSAMIRRLLAAGVREIADLAMIEQAKAHRG